MLDDFKKNNSRGDPAALIRPEKVLEVKGKQERRFGIQQLLEKIQAPATKKP